MAWRAGMAGWKAVFWAAATVSHDYDFDKGRSKWRHPGHNRVWLVLWKHSAGPLALLGPLLLAAEAGIALQSRRDGWWAEKRAAWRELFAARRELAQWRRKVQARRVLGDRPIVARMRGDMHTPLVESPILERVNPWMERYRRGVLRLLTR